jgi:hypothetical protein
MKQFTIVLTILVPLCIPACSRFFAIVSGGSLDSTVRFEFYQPGDNEKSRLRIVEFSVFLVENNAIHSPAIWSLSGAARVDQIEYGAAPRGLAQIAAPPPLQRGHVYFVEAVDKPIFNSIPGRGLSFFVVDSSGRIQDCERSECASLVTGA